jgi:hypothetical protein
MLPPRSAGQAVQTASSLPAGIDQQSIAEQYAQSVDRHFHALMADREFRLAERW